MVERIEIGYTRLFEIRLLHHYWLDEGAMVFDLIADQRKKNERLLSYDMRPFLAVAPTAASEQAIRELGGVFKGTALGCLVAVPKDTLVPDNVRFEFIVTIKDAAFFNYTALTLRLQKISEFYCQPEKKTYRYKAGVPVLSNATGASRILGSDKILFLSSEFPASDDGQVESIFLSGNAVRQLTADQSGAFWQIGANKDNLPVFVHQGDVHPIVPPSGLDGAPPPGVQLSDEIPDDVFALVHLDAVADDEAFSFIDNGGKVKTICPVFQIRFKNRSTSWRYFNKNTGLPEPTKSTNPDPLPLTYFGNTDTNKNQKPSECLVKAEDIGGKITRLVSEIYV